jgi:D-alanyl-D-alanine dipeptidase
MYTELGITECFMHPKMHEALMKLAPELEKRKLKLVIYDAFRPWIVQKFMYETAPDYLRPYIAPPPGPDSTGAFHTRGAAVDCYLALEDGTPLEFPTAPDVFYPGYENDPNFIKCLEKVHRNYDAPEPQKSNRQLLEDLMTSVGLSPLPEEWWHFNLPGEAKLYPIIHSLEDVEII